MDVRGILPVGVGDDLIGQADDGAVVLVQSSAEAVLLHGFGLRFSDQFAENVGDVFIQFPSVSSVAASGRRVEELRDVPAQADGEADVESGEGPLDIGDPVEISGIVGEDFNRGTIPLQRHPMVLLQIVDVEIPEQFDVDQRSLAVFDIGALVKLGDGFADVYFRNLVFLDQNAFEVRRDAFPRLRNGGVQFVL